MGGGGRSTCYTNAQIVINKSKQSKGCNFILSSVLQFPTYRAPFAMSGDRHSTA